MSRLYLSGRKPRILVLSIGLFVSIYGSGGTYAATFTQGRDVAPFSTLKNGDYVWKPEVSPAGPVLLVVSIPEQRLFVYRNGVRIGSSTVSTGRAGHSTPTGVFTILQKKVEHTSSIYKGASMPYMQRLTWDGIAMHAGKLPGYAASHGCIRLPLDFAKKLYSVTGKGTTVMITDGETTPATSGYPGYLLVAKGEEATERAGSDDYEWNPEEAPTGPVSIVFSAKSSRIYVFRDGVEIGHAVVRGGEDLEIGIHAYTALDSVDSEGRRQWSSIDTVGNGRAPELHDLAKHLSIPPAFLADVRAVIQPGTTLVISDAPIDRNTPVDNGVNVLTTDESSK